MGKSATTALLSTIHDWCSLLDKHYDIACVFFDFKKAFDSVPHQKMMEKLYPNLVFHQVFSHGYVVISVVDIGLF